MKKINPAVFIAAVLVLSLTGCSSSEAGSDAPIVIAGDTAASQEQTSGEESDDAGADEVQADYDMFTCVYEGTVIEMGAPAQPVLDALGSDFEVVTAPSCAYQGTDYEYTYDHLIIRAYTETMDDEEPKLSGVEFRDDTVTTAEGISIGSSRDDVVAAYGDAASEAEGGLIYDNGSVSVTFFLDGGSVSGISYNLDAE
jgi:hypothetical protein